MRSGPIQPGEIVCVTGANGFIASHLIGQLLEAGFVVRGTVRSVSDTAKTDHLMAMARDLDAVDRLSFHAADLMKPGSFDEAVAGVDAVVHCAASVVFNHPDPQKGIVDPSVDGTRNVLESVRRSGSVRRVVHTSSMVAVYGWNKPRDHVFTEADWNTASTLQNDPYGVAKVQGERTARELVDALPEAERFELIHLNPGMVFGPPLIKPHAKASPKLVRDVISRAQPGVPRLMLSVVDVRDVARAHVVALQHDAPPPRCLVFAENAWMTDLMTELQGMFPDVQMGVMAIPKPLVLLAAMADKTLNVRQLWHLVGRAMPHDNTLSRSAYGMVYRPVSETLRDTAAPMIEHGWARVKRK
jgi:nucleoside-diphosphate-sugar epimerase